jgi:hypothetical protein
MRRILLAALAALAACSAPRPCTRALCLTRLEGELEMKGMSGAVRVTPDVPKPPVVSDTEVTVLSGTAEFVNKKNLVSAPAGAAFRFTASTAPYTTLSVTAGSVEVRLSSAATPVSVPAGSSFLLQ